MKYYLDTEFIEGTQKQSTLSKLFGKSKPTIELISIGIVSQEGKEYYAISRDFNLKEAWNRYQLEEDNTVGARIGCLPTQKKVYWIRENVLKPIWIELTLKEESSPLSIAIELRSEISIAGTVKKHFTYKNLKYLINKYGKSNAQIAEEIKVFCYNGYWLDPKEVNSEYRSLKDCVNIEFYAYYADYDWVAFCWLFGKMTNLPEGFPMYCKDLKQEWDFVAEHLNTENNYFTLKQWVKMVKETHPDYPKQINEHNALGDAKWNKKLHEFLNSL